MKMGGEPPRMGNPPDDYGILKTFIVPKNFRNIDNKINFNNLYLL